MSNKIARIKFQHTAARRRLAEITRLAWADYDVSTHSRPKAAGMPPTLPRCRAIPFQHTAARRRLVPVLFVAMGAV